MSDERVYEQWMQGVPRVERLLNTARFLFRLHTWNKPSLYYNLVRLTGDRRAVQCVQRDTDICIEGFPRSANSFAVEAFQFAQHSPAKVAHHQHAPAQVIRACQWRIPCIVLIREPVEAIVSLKALHLEGWYRRKRRPLGFVIGFHLWARAYVSFYASIWPFRDGFVVALFPEVLQDFGQVIERVNAHFGTSFAVFDHTEDNVHLIRERVGFHALPNDVRADIKRQVARAMDEEIQRKPALARTIAQAREWYKRFVALARQTGDTH